MTKYAECERPGVQEGQALRGLRGGQHWQRQVDHARLLRQVPRGRAVARAGQTVDGPRRTQHAAETLRGSQEVQLPVSELCPADEVVKTRFPAKLGLKRKSNTDGYF